MSSFAKTAAAEPASKDSIVVARETFRAGEAAFARGDYLTAARSFEVSNQLALHPFTMFNAALAYDAAGQPGRAADYFALALQTRGLTPEQTTEANQRLSTIRESLGWIDVSATSGTRLWVGALEGVPLPTIVHLGAGEHRLRVVYPGGVEEQRAIVIEGGRPLAIRFDAPRAPIAKPPPAPPPQPSDSGPDPKFVGGWITLGLGVAAGGTAIGLGVAALSARDDFRDSGNRDADARRDAIDLRAATNVMWAVAGAATVTGTILVITGWGETETHVSVGIGTGGVDLYGSF